MTTQKKNESSSITDEPYSQLEVAIVVVAGDHKVLRVIFPASQEQKLNMNIPKKIPGGVKFG